MVASDSESSFQRYWELQGFKGGGSQLTSTSIFQDIKKLSHAENFVKSLTQITHLGATHFSTRIMKVPVLHFQF